MGMSRMRLYFAISYGSIWNRGGNGVGKGGMGLMYE